MVNVTCLLAKAESTVGFSFGIRTWTEMEIQCVKGMHRLKLISSENNAEFKGLIHKLSPPQLNPFSSSLYPVPQLQMKFPIVLVQLCSQPPFPVLHSLMSVEQGINL